MPFAATALAIPGVLMITPPRFDDARGAFIETYRANEFAALGIAARFVQDNLAISTGAGTLRGLHFQRPPHAQAKLVRVLRGAVYDVVVDLRRDLPTYGRALGVELTADNRQLFVPKGCAHGYCTLADDTDVAYRCDAYYAAAAEGGVNAVDPALAINWPMDTARAIISDKDRALPMLRDLVSPFALELS